MKTLDAILLAYNIIQVFCMTILTGINFAHEGYAMSVFYGTLSLLTIIGLILYVQGMAFREMINEGV